MPRPPTCAALPQSTNEPTATASNPTTFQAPSTLWQTTCLAAGTLPTHNLLLTLTLHTHSRNLGDTVT
jgi:hypothetical protein